jgi:hypothetical protein
MGQRASAPQAVTVTSENFGDLLIEGLKEAVEIYEGRRQPPLLRSYPVREGDYPPGVAER